jgi:hypothetical protein
MAHYSFAYFAVHGDSSGVPCGRDPASRKQRLVPGWMGQRELPRVHHATNGVNIMIRKVMMALAAVAVVTVGSASTAAAFRGGFGGGHMGGAHFGGAHFGGAHFSGMGHPGMAFRGHPFVGSHFARFDHRFFRHRFGHRFFFAGGFPYGYDSCYARVWTPWGWRWRYVCY